ncbi:MAG: hypothetical protein IIA89_13810 [Chloroflexi bacterium]|nr:hypothetical protein [Chloroflexota bacterium]
MMNLKKLFLEIESNEFAARLNLASGERLLMWSLATDPAVNRLEMELSEEIDHSLIVLGRIQQLVRLEFDFRFENPYDAAMSAYCWVLAQTNQQIGRVAAHLVASAKQTWWARKVAETVMDEFPASTKDNETRTDASFVELFKQVGVANLDEVQSMSATFLLSTLSLNAAKFAFVSSINAVSESSSSSVARIPSWIGQIEMPVVYAHHEYQQPEDIVLAWGD